MALTIGEAQAVNDLLRCTLRYVDQDETADDGVVSRGRAAAILLADHAHKPLMAGLTGDQVATRWLEISS